MLTADEQYALDRKALVWKREGGKPPPGLMLGLTPAEYSREVDSQMRAVLFLWYFSGVAYLFWHGQFLSLVTLLFLAPGVIVACVLAVPVVLLNLWLRWYLPHRYFHTPGVCWAVLVLGTIWCAGSVLSPIAGAIYTIRLIRILV